MCRNRMIGDDRVPERAKPAANRRDLAPIDVGVPVPGNEADDHGDVASRLRVADGVVGQARVA